MRVVSVVLAGLAAVLLQVQCTDWSDTNEVSKDLVTGFASLIPEIGGILGLLLGLFWPESAKQDIWEMIKDRVEEMIDDAILKAELEDFQLSIEGLRESMKSYQGMHNTERGNQLTAMLETCQQLSSRMCGSTHHIHMLPLTVTFAGLHLSLMSERYHHGAKLYPKDHNRKFWGTELVDKYSFYKSYHNKTYHEFRQWRSDKIQAFTSKPGYYAEGHVIDTITKTQFYFGGMDYDGMGGPTDENQLKSTVNAKKGLYLQEFMLPTIELLKNSFSFNCMLPDAYKDPDLKPDVMDALRVIEFGPYLSSTVGANRGTLLFTPYVLTPDHWESGKLGNATGVSFHLIQPYGVWAMQLQYSKGQGMWAGRSSQSPYVEDIKNRTLAGFGLEFCRYGLTGVQALYTNKDTGPYHYDEHWPGDPHGEDPRGRVTVKGPEDYMITAIGFTVGDPDHKDQRIYILSFRFTHVSLIDSLDELTPEETTMPPLVVGMAGAVVLGLAGAAGTRAKRRRHSRAGGVAVTAEPGTVNLEATLLDPMSQ